MPPRPDPLFFISYARNDRSEYLDAFFRDLTQILDDEFEHESSCFRDHRIGWGREWGQEIDTRINGARALIFIISHRSIASDWCAREFGLIRKREDAAGLPHQYILPVLWRVAAHTPSLLSQIQHAPGVSDPAYQRYGLQKLYATGKLPAARGIIYELKDALRALVDESKPLPVHGPPLRLSTIVNPFTNAHTELLEEELEIQPLEDSISSPESFTTTLLDHAISQAKQELWSGVPLADFGAVVPRIRPITTPFHQWLSDPPKRIPLTDGIRAFALRAWEKLDWKFAPPGRDKTLAPSVLYITGEAGIGKTASLKLAVSSLAQEGEIVPIYAHLGDVLNKKPGATRFEDRLDAYLADIQPDLWVSNLEDYLGTARGVVLVLDSFDEAALSAGDSRLSIISQLQQFCAEQGLVLGRDTNVLKCIILASRHKPSYAEEQMLRPTVVSLGGFEDTDIEAWLHVFNSKAKLLLPDGTTKEPKTKLELSWFRGDSPRYPLFQRTVEVPLYLYLLSCLSAIEAKSMETVHNALDQRMTRHAAQYSAAPDEEDLLSSSGYLILRTFLDRAIRSDFLKFGAWNRNLTTAVPWKPADDTVRKNLFLAVVKLASDSEVRQVRFRGTIAGVDAERVGTWLVRALPLEHVVGESVGGGVWRFPHLSLVDFYLATRLTDDLLRDGSLCEDIYPNRNPAAWWRSAADEVIALTTHAGEMTISDRAFAFVEEHLRSNRLDRGDGDQVAGVMRLATAWSRLQAVVVKNVEQTENEMAHRGRFFVAPRRLDIGLRISNLGLPLMGCCARVLNLEFGLGHEADEARFGLRRYLRLASFVTDSDFANRSDINRFPLRRLNAVDSAIEGVDMKDMEFSGASFRAADLQYAYLLGADLRGIRLGRMCNLRDCNLVGADLSLATLEDGLQIDGATLYRAVLSGTIANGTHFVTCNLADARLTKARLAKSRFDRCSLQFALFDDADLSGATLKDSVLNRASFGGADLRGAHLVSGVWVDVQFHLAQPMISKETWVVEPVGLPPVAEAWLREAGATFMSLVEYEERTKDDD